MLDKVLEIEDWCVRRGNEFSVGPLSLDFTSGSVTTFIGPSGVGKTTLLMSILGYEEAGLKISGRRRQDGKALPTGAVPKHALYIPQHLPFNPNWEVQGFLSRLPWGRSKFLDLFFPFRSERRQQVREVLEQLGIAHRARATIAELSGGEAQRAALAQMLLLKPRLMIGDEFVSALDPGMSSWILDRCREEISQSSGAAILALHDVQAAMHVSDRILLMWPFSISAQPWQIKRDTPAWHGSVLYSLSCLARWAKDLSPTPSLLTLTSYLDSWINDEASLFEFLNSFENEETLVIDDAGNAVSTRDGMERSTLFNSSLSNWTDMMPVQWTIRDERQIGVAIPRGGAMKPLVVLASTKSERQ